MDSNQKKENPVKRGKFGAAGILLLLFVMAAGAFSTAAGLLACGPARKAGTGDAGSGKAAETAADPAGKETPVAPELAGLACTEEIIPEYAEGFSIFRYEGGYTFIGIPQGTSCLVVPEGSSVPEGLPEDAAILRQPLDRVYMAASSVMALYRALGAVDRVAFSATAADQWYVEEAKEAMLSGDILFAGKYSAPDYELLLDRGCSAAIESTMIYHHPEVKEKLESLGIPVFVDQSSYEQSPLGRMEWIRVYGELTGQAETAEAFFRAQEERVRQVEEDVLRDSGERKTAAFFYISSGGQAVVRTGDDYIAEMISMAGGQYVLSGLRNANPDSRSGSVSLTMEEFYRAAKDADYLVYNTNIDSSVTDLSEMLEKNSLLGDFAAVKNGRVFVTDRYFYQATDILGEMIVDFHRMFAGEDDGGMTFLRRLR